MALTLGIALGLARLAEQQLRERFELLADERFSRLAERFAEQAQRLDSLRQYFLYSDQVQRSEFNGFAAPLLHSTQAYGWLPRVTDDERAAFEAQAQAEGAPGFVIRERAGNEWVPAARRPEYYPVLYMRGASHLQLPLGYDQLGEPIRGQALRRAIAGGTLSASAPLNLVGVDPAFAQGVLLAMPVYDASSGSGPQRPPPKGFVTAAISIRQLMADGFPAAGQDMLREAITDVTEPEAPIRFFGSPEPAAPLSQVRALPLADHVYQVQILPSDVFLRANRGAGVLVIVLQGGVLSVLLAALLYSVVSQRQRALRLVARRTLALADSEERLRNTYGQLRSVLDAATEIAIIATDLSGQITTFNAGAERMLGYRGEQVLGRLNLGDLHVHHELREQVRQRAETHGQVIPPSRAMLADSLEAGGQPQAQQWSLVRRNGSRLTVNMLVTAVRDGDGAAVGHLAVCIDVTESRRVHEALAARDRLLEKLSAEVPGGIYQFKRSADGRNAFTYVSRGMQDIYEVPLEQLMADAAPVFFERIHPDDQAGVRESFRVSATELRRWRQEYRVCLPGQGLRWVRGEATPEATEDGAIVWHGYLADITDLKRVEEELRALSVTDALTGIYNRRYFQERLKIELGRAEREAAALAVIMLDIDHFKRINDQLGHAMGDKVLQVVCRRIGQRLRRTDVFCRLGGEEFMVLCPGSDAAQAACLAEELQQALRDPPVEGVGVVTASFGIAAWRREEGADALLLRADAGVYAAKQAGRDRVQGELG